MSILFSIFLAFHTYGVVGLLYFMRAIPLFMTIFDPGWSFPSSLSYESPPMDTNLRNLHQLWKYFDLDLRSAATLLSCWGCLLFFPAQWGLRNLSVKSTLSMTFRSSSLPFSLKLLKAWEKKSVCSQWNFVDEASPSSQAFKSPWHNFLRRLRCRALNSPTFNYCCNKAKFQFTSTINGCIFLQFLNHF